MTKQRQQSCQEGGEKEERNATKDLKCANATWGERNRLREGQTGSKRVNVKKTIWWKTLVKVQKSFKRGETV